MLLTANNVASTEIANSVICKVLGIYPEECLIERPVFREAFIDGSIDIDDLREESAKMSIPWQFFLLEEIALDKELKKIEDLRHKASERLFVKRKGEGEVTSKRILDRMIRAQCFVSENGSFPPNTFIGSLKGKSMLDAASHIQLYFDINLFSFRKLPKFDALEYLISRIEDRNINVCRGVLSNQILPLLDESKDVYRNTSGFAIRDDKVPFVFLPSEVNPSEAEGRQIYTLVYLVVLIGLDSFDHLIQRNYGANVLKAKGADLAAHRIASEFLLPTSETDKYRGVQITEEDRDTLSRRFKITPSAVVTIFKLRGFFKTNDEYDMMMPLPVKSEKRRKGGAVVPIEKSVRKFSGRHAYDVINGSIKSERLSAVPAQYLIFGCVRKKKFRQYRKNLSI